MPINSNSKREIPKIHKDIEEVGKRIKEKKQKMPEKEESKERDKEIIKEAIKEKTEKPAPSKTSPAAEPAVSSRQVVRKTKQIKGEEKERQIELLADLAFEKGVNHAIEIASKLDSPYILDEFHDKLVDELYKYLVEQDKLKRV